MHNLQIGTMHNLQIGNMHNLRIWLVLARAVTPAQKATYAVEK